MKNKFISSISKRFATTILKNGLKVVAYQDRSFPEVLMQVAYDVGSANETSQTRGMAHLVEHMIFKGTEKMSEVDLDSISRKFGASSNAFTSHDKTCFFFEVDSTNWKHLLPVLADCMSNARFDPQHLASEIKAVIQELNMYKDDLQSVIFEASCAAAFRADHPYHYPIIGYLSSLAALEANDLHNFYKQNYCPSKATLYIAGDIDIQDAIDFAAKTFDSVKRSLGLGDNRIPILQERWATVSSCQNIIYFDTHSPISSYFWTIPSMYQPLLEERAGAANTILSRGLQSRLYKKLVDKLTIATDVSGVVNSMNHGGLYSIQVMADNESSLKKCTDVIKKQIKGIKIKQSELKKFIQREILDFYQAMEDVQEVVNKLSYSPLQNPEEAFDYQSRLEMLNCQMLEQFIEQHLNPDLINCITIAPFKDQAQRELWLENTHKQQAQELIVLEKFTRTTDLEKPRLLYTIPDPETYKVNFPEPDVVKTLANGMTIVFKHRENVPVVHTSIGFRNDEYLAHSKEGILFNFAVNCLIEGNELASKEQILNGFENLGADFSLNKTAFHLSCQTNVFLKAFRHLIKIVSAPSFSENGVDNVKRIVVDSLNRESDDLHANALRASFKELFENDEFSWNFDQMIDLVSNANGKGLEKIYRRNFTPINLVIVVVGHYQRTDLEQIISTLEQTPLEIFDPNNTEPKTKEFDASKAIIKVPMLKDQVLLTFSRRSEFNIKSPNIEQIGLLNIIIFKSIGSRLYQLRERYGLFYEAGGGFACDFELFKGIDKIKALVAKENVQPTIDLINSMFEDLNKNGITSEELKHAKQIYQKQLLEGYCSNSAIAQTFLDICTKNLSFDFHKTLFQAITEEKNDQIEKMSQLCKKLCTTDSFVKVIVGNIST